MKWVVLCVSNDAASLLLYQSMLELDGHSTLVETNGGGGLKVSEGTALDCVVVDCKDNGVSVTMEMPGPGPGFQYSL